jgi:hypothetical protein
MDDSDAFQLQRGGKTSWFDNHRKFLPHTHPYRRNRNWFLKNRVVTEEAGEPKSGEEILNYIDALGLRKITDCGGEEWNKGVARTTGCGWKKRSIFWDLPYWSSLLIRHNLDVMHIEKNFFDNLFNTIMNIEGKSKDNVKSREDLLNLCRRRELGLDPSTGKYPKATYTLDKKRGRLFVIG